MRACLAILAILSAALAGAQQRPSPAPAACQQLTVAAYPALAGPPSSGRPDREKPLASFSAARVADLEFGVIIPPRPTQPDHFQIRLFTPAGHLYQAVDLPVARPGNSPEAARSLPGYPFPVPVAQPESADDVNRGAVRVRTRVPLGGTLVSTSSLYGRWRAEGWAASDRAPCATVSFEVSP